MGGRMIKGLQPMLKSACQVGMRVRATRAYDSKDQIVGKLGTIRKVHNVGDIVLVEFDEHIDGHGDGGIKYGHAWNVGVDALEPIKDKKGKIPQVEYILQYMKDADPFEVFYDLESAKKRIAVLAEDRYVKRDSFVLYKVAKIHAVTVSMQVSVSK